jgi:hypothetical protein
MADPRATRRCAHAVGNVHHRRSRLLSRTSGHSRSRFRECHLEKLYLQYFARDCGSLANCVQITEAMIPRGGALKLIQRNYVVPGSTRGPDPKQVVNPSLIVFDGANLSAATAENGGSPGWTR